MLEELRWKTSLSATALHAALCRVRGIPAADAAFGNVMGPAADALAAEVDAAQWPRIALLEQLTGLASELDNNRELVTRAAAKLHLPPRDPALLVRIAGGIADLEATLLREQPDLAEELAVRCGPLREQWEARGPGMLLEIARLTEADVIPQAAEIVLVAPYAGGCGLVHARQNRVTMEGVLFHPVPALPEPVRVAWLISQLNSDLPRYGDWLPAGRASFVFATAMAAPTLAAAQEVELATCDETTLATAFDAWGIAADLPSDAPERVWNWWNAWSDQQATWPVAVAALERMLA